VGDADGELGQGLPQRLLLGRAAFPRGFEHLMRVERQTAVEQVLRVLQ
jgi:hypothetical protein